jgi:dTDP-4-dehydrorhamnose reductase
MRGNNFLTTILRLAKERQELNIVDDQYGAPTWCGTIADVTAHIISQSKKEADVTTWYKEQSGIYHVTPHGKTTWYAFAKAILALSSIADIPIIPIKTEDYASSVVRPMNSALDTSKLRNRMNICLNIWQEDLESCFLPKRTTI